MDILIAISEKHLHYSLFVKRIIAIEAQPYFLGLVGLYLLFLVWCFLLVGTYCMSKDIVSLKAKFTTRLNKFCTEGINRQVIILAYSKFRNIDVEC